MNPSPPVSLDPKAALKNIESLFAQTEYKNANRKIDVLLKQSDLSSAVRGQLYWMKGICHISQGEEKLAKASFLNVLAITPGFKPDENTSPKILKVYNETLETLKKQLAQKQPIKTSFSPIDTIPAGEKFAFEVRIASDIGLNKIGRLRFYLRQLGNSDYSTLDFKRVKENPSHYSVEIPQLITSRIENDSTFEYFVEILSPSKEIIGEIGSKALPLSFVVTAKSKPVSQKTLDSDGQMIVTAVWFSAAALSVASVATLAYVFSSPDSGNLRVRVYPPE